MASDENISIFAHNICCSFWKIDETFRNDDIAYQIRTDSKESSDPCFVSASWLAIWFYEDTIRINTSKNYNKYLQSKKDFSNYIRHMCNCENWMGKPSIFERVFASLSFVLVCTNCIKGTSNNMKRYAPTCWEEYFMEYIEEFYSKGGWGELKRLSRSYCRVLEFLSTVEEKYSPGLLTRISKSIENYLYFIANRKLKIVSLFVKSLKIKCGSECKTSATLWIQFTVKNFKEHSFSCTQTPKNASEVTCLMRVLRYLCNPSESEDPKFEPNFVYELDQKSKELIIYLSDKNQETSRIQTELSTKGMLQHSGMQSNDSESLEQSCSSSMNSRLLGKSAIEKENDDKFSGISSFTDSKSQRIEKISKRRIKDTNASSVKIPSIKTNNNNWATQKVDETEDELVNRLERFILSSDKDTSTGELHGKCKNKFKKKNYVIRKK